MQSRQTLGITADANVWGADSAFSLLNGYPVHLDVREHQEITASAIKNSNILIVRSTTKVNRSLIEGSDVRFVGTATIGDDHVDKVYLKEQGITFSCAAGSSTESVVEYMLATFYHLQSLGRITLNHTSLGIIGVGRIGSLLERACNKVGVTTLRNDPPRAAAEGSKGFHELSYLLEHADILTLHTPLIEGGSHPTRHLLGEKELSQFKGKGIINAGRGVCLDNRALLAWLNSDPDHFAVLDCWENEPSVDLNLVNHPQLLIATPHIAGHSLDGKAANTFFVYRDLCDYLEVPCQWRQEDDLPAIVVDPSLPIEKQALALHLYPIDQDSHAMKLAASSDEAMKAWFGTYRRNYPVRRSWKKTLAAHQGCNESLFF